jgi:hypothetical protein
MAQAWSRITGFSAMRGGVPLRSALGAHVHVCVLMLKYCDGGKARASPARSRGTGAPARVTHANDQGTGTGRPHVYTFRFRLLAAPTPPLQVPSV